MSSNELGKKNSDITNKDSDIMKNNIEKLFYKSSVNFLGENIEIYKYNKVPRDLDIDTAQDKDFFKNLFQIHEREIKCMKHYSKLDKIAIDMGTWVGYFTIFLGRLNKTVIGIECDPLSYKNTILNLKKNNIENFILYDKPIFNNNKIVNVGPNTFSDIAGAFNGSCSMVEKYSPNYVKSEFSDDSIKIESITFSEIVKYFKPEDISIIKIDIESSEEEVLPDVLNWFDRKFPILCSFHIIHPDNGDNWWLDINLENKDFFKKYEFYEFYVEKGVYKERKLDNVIEKLKKYPLLDLIIK